MKNKLMLVPVCLAALVLCAPEAADAARKKTPPLDSNTAEVPVTPPKETPPAEKSPMGRSVPFHGTISAVDQTAMTFTIAGREKERVFKVTDTTVLTKAGLTATMKDIAANDEVRGSYRKAGDGSLEVRSAKIGPKTEAEKAASPKRSKKNAKTSGDDTSSVTSSDASQSTTR